MNGSLALGRDQLVNRCDPATLGFETTAELEDLPEPFGQQRATDALDFALGVSGAGYNVYVMGPAGSGRHRTTERVLRSAAARHPSPSDWCYVHNFNEARKPKYISLPAGEGLSFRRDMQKLVDELRVALPGAFESESYRHRRAEINREFEERNQQALEAIQSEAEHEGLGLVQTPHGFVIAPVRGEEVVGPEEFQKLPEDERTRLSDRMEKLSKELQRHVGQLPVWQRERHRRIVALDREVTMTAVAALMRELEEKYHERASVLEYLKEVERDLVQHAHELRRPDEPVVAIPFLARPEPELTLRRYQVHVIVDNGETQGLPVVYESNPILTNILGRAEHQAEQGVL
ncbi:MAG TPA: ATP-binding protein, partial [Gammaproteobacteria bacterium]|nr:ATP-binding protein [Gammaproteobacteria bacterium]